MGLFYYTLLSEPRIIETTKFIHGLSYPEEGVHFDHLTAFCSLGYDNCYLCFDGEQVIDFDPLELNDPQQIVAPSFTEFLERLIQTNGAHYWLQSSP